MTASDNLNGQLKMFMTGGEIMDSITMTADDPKMGSRRVMEAKATKAAVGSAGNVSRRPQPGSPTLLQSILREGVREPIQLIHTDNNLVHGQGHHRTAVANEMEIYHNRSTFVPVVHTDARTGTGLEGADDPDSPKKRMGAMQLSRNPYAPVGPGRSGTYFNF